MRQDMLCLQACQILHLSEEVFCVRLKPPLIMPNYEAYLGIVPYAAKIGQQPDFIAKTIDGRMLEIPR